MSIIKSEEWKRIAENPEFGFVSNLGRVKSGGKIRAVFPSATGYLRVGFMGGKYTRLVHRLVAEAFIGSAPDAHECNHKDGNKANNALENLEWVTKKENIRHAYDNGLRVGTHRKKKLTDRVAIEKMVSCGMTQRAIAKELGVTQSSISIFLKGRKTPVHHFQWRNPN